MSGHDGDQAQPTRTADEIAAYELTDRDRGILELERKSFKFLGIKEELIRERFGISMTRYQQLVQFLIDTPAALAYDAPLVTRLRRLRDQRRGGRTARRHGYG